MWTRWRALLFFGISRSAGSFAVPDVVSTYQHCLESAPLLTKATTSSVIFSAGDALAQSLGEDSEDISVERVVRFAGTGFGNGIAWSTWYDFSDQLLAPLNEPALRIAGAMAIEQFLWCPILFALYIIPLSAALNGAPVAQLPAEVRKRLGPLLIANAKVWTPANLVIYNVPLQYRVLTSNAVDLIWAAICSETAAECGSDGGCLVSAPNIIMGDDGCALPSFSDDQDGADGNNVGDGVPTTTLTEESEELASSGSKR